MYSRSNPAYEFVIGVIIPITNDKVRVIKKAEMFADKRTAQAWRDFIQNHFTRALLNYDVDNAKAINSVLVDIKLLAENAKANIKFE